MNNLLIDRYLRLIEPLSFDLKLELLNGITKSLKDSKDDSMKKKDRII
jgi:hypothetical protein